MSKNDITGDRLVTKTTSDAYRNNYDAIFKKPVSDDGPGEEDGPWAAGWEERIRKPFQPPFTCKYCGAPSWVDPSDQSPPPNYCHESDHGDPTLYEGV